MAGRLGLRTNGEARRGGWPQSVCIAAGFSNDTSMAPSVMRDLVRPQRLSVVVGTGVAMSDSRCDIDVDGGGLRESSGVRRGKR